MLFKAPGNPMPPRQRLLNQTLRVMRITAFFLFVLCMQVSATGLGQKITLSLKDVPLSRVFDEISRQAGVSVVYKEALLAKAQPVSIDVHDATIQQVLLVCLKDQPFSYRIEDGLIVIQSQPSPAPDLIRGNRSSPPSAEIHGRVTDSTGAPLAGASVQIRGAKRGVQTDGNGVFRLSGIQDGDILDISFTGFLKKEIKVTSQVNFSIVLTRSSSPLDEVQIVAYGTTTTRLNVGSIAKVSSEVIEEQPVTNPLNAIEGRVAGVFVQTQNGLPGGNVTIQVRGQNSITAGLDPLYVVDGVPFTSTALNSLVNYNLVAINGNVSPLNSIPPGEIESIEILKDADATAIYGSRGSNGVVLITTKRGKAGKTKLDISVNEGATSLAEKSHFMDLKQYLALSREGFKNDGTTPSSDPNSPYYAPFLTVWDTTKSTDWQKFLFGNINHVTQGNATLSGGTTNTNFVLGGNFRKEGSVLPGNSSYEREGVYMNVNHNYQNFHGMFSVSYTSDKNNLLANSVATSALSLAPDYPIYNPDGTFNWYTNNPLAWVEQKNYNNTSNLVLSGLLKYDILPNLFVKADFGYTKITSDMTTTVPGITNDPSFGIPSEATYGSVYNQTFLVEPQAQYTQQLGKGKLTILAGSTFQQSLTDGWSVLGSNYSSDQFLDQISYAGLLNTPSNTYSQYKYFSIFSRINYVFDDKYILDLTGRRDGSSKFGPQNEYGNFGSAGAGWIFSEENFIKRTFKALSHGKIRGSYGVTGNDQITPYQYIATYTNGYTSYQGTTPLNPSTVANGKYGWERNRKAEIGLDFGFLKDRIFLTVDAYENRCNNLLVKYPLPYTSGLFASYQANLPALIQNKGLEFQLTTQNFQTKHFQWETTVNLTLPNNKLLAFPGLNTTAYANTYVVGKDLSIIKGWQFTGVDPQTGIAQFKDQDHDGKLSYPNDYVVIGKTSPDYYGGMGNTFKYNGFQLNIFFQFVGQHSKTGTPDLTTPYYSDNSFTNTLNRWQKPGDITTVQLAAEGGNAASANAWNNIPQSSLAIINTNYVRLKNISLSYNLPGSLARKGHFQQVKLYIQGQDLLVFTKDKNIDPETLSGNNNTVPVLKSIVGGIQITL
jgi:TonB-linked SusC/RagA family outer membrane protein